MKYRAIEKEMHLKNELDMDEIDEITDEQKFLSLHLVNHILEHEDCPAKADTTSSHAYDINSLVNYWFEIQS